MSYTGLKTAELRKLAEEKSVKGYSKLNRKELIAALEALEPEAPEAPVEADAPEEESTDPVESPEPSSPAPVVSGPGVREGHIAPGSKAEKMKAALAKQPKVRVMIQLGSGEKIGSTESVILNGYRLNIQKGTYVDVPQQVAEIIAESQRQTLYAVQSNPKKLDGDEKALR